MLNYQSTSFHDALYLREALGLRRAPEFEAWMERAGLADRDGRLQPGGVRSHPLLAMTDAPEAAR
jgi:ethanolamine ammonia-lyase large subunit